MLPPFDAIVVPAPSAIAPAPLASRSALRTTFNAFAVPTEAPEVNTMSLSAWTVSVLPAAPVRVLVFSDAVYFRARAAYHLLPHSMYAPAAENRR